MQQHIIIFIIKLGSYQSSLIYFDVIDGLISIGAVVTMVIDCLLVSLLACW